MAKSRTHVVIAVRRPQRGGLGDHVGIRREGAQEVELARVGERCEIGFEDRQPLDPPLGGAPADRRDPRVRVLHVIHGILHRLRRHEVEVEGLLRVDALQQEGEPHDVGIDLVEDVGERDDVAGPLRQRDQLAAALELHQLPEQHLRLTRGVSERFHAGLQRLHLAVVVGAPDVDEVLPPSLELVPVVRDVGAGDTSCRRPTSPATRSR